MIRLATMFTGGLSAIEFALRYEDLSYKHVIGAEWDKYARKQCIQFHGAADDFHEDVSKFNGSKYIDKIDLLVWGSSCQNFSLAGNREGLDGDKSKYFIDGLERQKEMMPKKFIFENVRGMLSSNKGMDFKYAIEEFRSMGYHIAYKILNAKEYGTAQNRERIFIVGFLKVDEYHSFSFEKPIKLLKTLRDYLDDVVDEKYYLSQKMIDGFISHKARHEEKGTGFKWNPKCGDDIASCLRANGAICPTDNTIKEPRLNQAGVLDIKGSDSIKRVYADDGLCPTLTTMGGA